MASVFIFAEQIRSIVRSGKKEIEIPAGARISSAAADLIKEYQIQVKTVAPSRASSVITSQAENILTEKIQEASRIKKVQRSTGKSKSDTPNEMAAEISEDELEEIVTRVIERIKKLKGGGGQRTTSEDTAKAASKAKELTDDGDLIICRCEEITRGEIKEAIRNGLQTLNGIKRVTRAGMGLCQGQTCQRLVAQILTQELNLSAADIDPTTARGPVRPLRLEVFANS